MPQSPCRPRRAARLAFSLGLVGATWLAPGAFAADQPAPPKAKEPVLTLVDGEALPGAIAESDQAGAIAWQSPAFAAPFHFPLIEVASVQFPVAGKPPAAPGAFGFALGGGGMIYGTLVGLDKDAAELDTPRFGRLKVDRAMIQRITRWDDGRNLIYDGPNGLAGWRAFSAFQSIADQKPGARPARLQAQGQLQAQMMPGVVVRDNLNGIQMNAAPATPVAPPDPPGPPWVEDGGQLATTQGGAAIQADVGLPTRASVEIELSWHATPNFVLALGVGDDEKTVARAFRFEIWENQLVALRETDDEATLNPVLPIPTGAGRVHLRVDLNQEAGKLVVRSAAGDRLADLALGGGPTATLPGVRLTNIAGDLRLERLRVTRMVGTDPAPAAPRGAAEAPADPATVRQLLKPEMGAADALVTLVDRATVRGRLDRYDASTHEFLIEGDAGTTRVAEGKVDGIALPRGDAERVETVRVVYADGTELGGKWIGLTGQQLTLTVAGINGILTLPLQGVRSLEFPRQERPKRDRDEALGTLELDGLKLVGRLAAGSEPGQGGLAWQPLASTTASPIRPGTSGRIVYKEEAAPANRNLAADPNDPAVQLARAKAQRAAQLQRVNAANGVAATKGRGNDTGGGNSGRSLYLRSGDIVPVTVTSIDEAGVYFRSSMLTGQFVPNARIKALELAPPDPNALLISKAKYDRLLTLPRMQKESPPTHLIRSKNGDILRGRVIGLDDKALKVEVRLDEKEVPRERVSLLVWLHPDEVDPSKKPPETPEPPAGAMRVQAVRTDGVRLTFAADGFADGAVVGKSDVLGPCKVETKDLEQLLLGGTVEQEAVQVAYQNLRLHRAIEPKSAADDEAGDGDAGTEAALVGKDAPDFKLDLLDEAKFHLADTKGTVVVLDFWATWCGPCLQAMPQVEKVAGEFADRGVRLVAVNLQETPAKIKAMLERQKLSPTVALDRNGAVAKLYGANAIPQTVVIDRNGKVTRVFVGSSPKLGDNLREAINAALPPAQE